MSADLYPWILIGHIFSIVVWISMLCAVSALLGAHHGADVSSRTGLVSAARSLALVMDIAAAAAIGLGLYLAFASPAFPDHAFKTGGWLHVKLTVVVVGIIGTHGFLRGKLKRFRDGSTGSIPRWVIPVVLACAAAAVLLGEHPTLLRK